MIFYCLEIICDFTNEWLHKLGVIIVENNEIIWNEVVDFFSKKYVAIKAALGGSTIDIQGDNVNVNLRSKSKFMLEQRNSDKLIE